MYFPESDVLISNCKEVIFTYLTSTGGLYMTLLISQFITLYVKSGILFSNDVVLSEGMGFFK